MIQITGLDHVVLRVADAYQQVSEWHLRVPNPSKMQVGGEIA